eukprot:scaffold8.g1706.t1
MPAVQPEEHPTMPPRGLWSPLLNAAAEGDAAAIHRILAESPGAAMDHRFCWLPLHVASSHGHAAAVAELLAAAPQAASVTGPGRKLPLYFAAVNGHAAVVQLLLAAAPQTERAKTDRGKRALVLAASQGHLPAVRVLVERSAAPPAELIANLLEVWDKPYGGLPSKKSKKTACALLTDLAASRSLSPADWAALPTPCPGLAHALPAVLARSPAEAAQHVAHLLDTARGRLRALVLSLARLQRRLGLKLPESIVRRILVAALVEEEREADAAEPSSSEEESEGGKWGSSEEEWGDSSPPPPEYLYFELPWPPGQ